jgi:hypothetical protein
VEADCRVLPRAQFWNTAGSILHEAEGEDDGVDG